MIRRQGQLSSGSPMCKVSMHAAFPSLCLGISGVKLMLRLLSTDRRARRWPSKTASGGVSGRRRSLRFAYERAAAQVAMCYPF
jgi:hypothetical protein